MTFIYNNIEKPNLTEKGFEKLKKTINDFSNGLKELGDLYSLEYNEDTQDILVGLNLKNEYLIK